MHGISISCEKFILVDHLLMKSVDFTNSFQPRDARLVSGHWHKQYEIMLVKGFVHHATTIGYNRYMYWQKR